MDTVHVYVDESGRFRWRRVAPNGRIVSESGQGYRSKRKCLHGLSRALDPNYLLKEQP